MLLHTARLVELQLNWCSDTRCGLLAISVLQPRAHKAKLLQKSALPVKPKFSIGGHVHYRDFTRNRPKWVAGKVTAADTNIKLRSVPKLNRQRRLNRSAAFDSERYTKWISSDMTTVFQNLMFTSTTRPRTKNCLDDQPVLPRRSTRVTFGIPPMILIAE